MRKFLLLVVTAKVVTSIKASIPCPADVRGITTNRYEVFARSAVTSYPVREPS